MEPLFDIGPIWAVLSCALLTVWFVGSLYLWPESRTLHRDAPLQIKRRFASVGLVCLTATIYLYYWCRSVCIAVYSIQSHRIYTLVLFCLTHIHYKNLISLEIGWWYLNGWVFVSRVWLWWVFPSKLQNFSNFITKRLLFFLYYWQCYYFWVLW